MKILLLGSTGYLGNKLVYRFLQRGYTVYALVRETSNVRELLKNGITLENIYRIDDLPELLAENNIDLFVNCACCYEKVGIKPEQIWEANYIVPLNIILKCVEHGVRRIITLDTALPNNFNFYSKSKAQLAEFLEWYAYKTNVFVENILLENYYGENEPTNRFIPYVLSSLKENKDIFLTEGTQKRDFIYIEDVLSAIEILINHKPNEKYKDIPLGTGEGPTVREVVQYLAQITYSSSKLIFGAVQKRENEPDSIANMSYLESLGWKYKYSWKDGLKKLL